MLLLVLFEDGGHRLLASGHVIGEDFAENDTSCWASDFNYRSLAFVLVELASFDNALNGGNGHTILLGLLYDLR